MTVDYGWLAILSQPLFWLLCEQVRTAVVGNWGVAIIIVTILIKLAFYKLTESSGRIDGEDAQTCSRVMKAMQERYKDDRQKQSPGE